MKLGLAIAAFLWIALGGSAMAFELRSPAFQPGGEIPVKHTCDGPDVSPPLSWTGAPERTKSLALIVDDPDAPAATWVHWVLYDIPATVRELARDVPSKNKVPGVGTQGFNDFGHAGWGGPCPPRGRAHRYVFTLYALDTELALPARKTKQDVLKALDGHVLGRAELIGRYQRR